MHLSKRFWPFNTEENEWNAVETFYVWFVDANRWLKNESNYFIENVLTETSDENF